MTMTMMIKMVTILVDGGHDALVIPLIMKINHNEKKDADDTCGWWT